MAAKEAVRSQARPYGQIWYPPNHAKCGIVKSSSTALHFKMKCIEWLSGDRADIKKIYQLRIHKYWHIQVYIPSVNKLLGSTSIQRLTSVILKQP
ncbi:hypothetical protein T06_15910 [Trichinella sp. T6]|nr:hypothetical protein T06_15910 [Trichinella sp. T6]